jgi:hypothetical protein
MKRLLQVVFLFSFVVLGSALFAQDNTVNFINAEGTYNLKDAQDFFDNPSAYAGKTITMLVNYSYSKANLQGVVGLNVPFVSYMNAAGNHFHLFIKKDLAVPSATYFQLLKVTFYRGQGTGDDVNIALSISKVY